MEENLDSPQQDRQPNAELGPAEPRYQEEAQPANVLIMNIVSVPINVPSNFSKSVCAENFFCATFFQDSSVYGTTCMKYVQNHFGKEHLYVLQVFFCASSHGFCAPPPYKENLFPLF